MVDYGLKDKISLVTGGSGGIGSAIAVSLAESGAMTYVHYNSKAENANKVVDIIRLRGGEAQSIQADIANNESVSEMVSTIMKEKGRIDILINNAGVNRETLFVRLKEDDISYVLGVNLIGLIHVTRLCAVNMFKNHYGRIVHISSPAAIAGSPAQSIYSASKAALHGFSKSLAQELGSRNITSNVILPGIVNTEIIKNLTDKRRQEFIDRIPVGRFAEPVEIAEAVCFIVSEQARYINGAELHVTGGGSVF